MAGKFKNIIGLYKSDPTKGKSSLHGKTRDAVNIPAGTKVWVFKNDRKEKDTHPDYNLAMIVEEEEGGAGPSQPKAAPVVADLPF